MSGLFRRLGENAQHLRAEARENRVLLIALLVVAAITTGLGIVAIVTER